MTKNNTKFMTSECKKIKYASSEEAQNELKRIVEGNDYRSWKANTPHRFYECEFCSKPKKPIYHLTSKICLTY